MPATFTHEFVDREGFEQVVRAPGTGPLSVVLAAICEVDGPGGPPFQGAASMEIHNVVPENGQVRVRGFIGFESNLRVRLNVFRAAP